MSPAAEYSMHNDIGCGLVGALFHRGGSKPCKPAPPPAQRQLPATKNQSARDPRRRRSSSDQRLKWEPSRSLSTAPLGNLNHKENQNPSKTTQKKKNSNVKTGNPGATAMMGNIVRHPSSRIITCLGKNMNPEALKSMGNESYREGRYEEALNLYNQAIAINPQNPCYYSNKSAALIGLSRLIEAVFECRKAIRLDPFYQNAQYRLANLYFRLGESEKAVFHYKQSGRKARAKDIAQAKALNTIINRCGEAQGVQAWATLLKESQSAFSLGSDSAPQIFAMQAEALVKLHRHEEAYTALEKGPGFTTDECTSLFGSAKTAYILAVKAHVHLAVGRFEDALKSAKKAVELDQSSESNALLLNKIRGVALARSNANGLFKASKFAEASTMYTQGLGHDPFNAVLLFNRAVCRSKLGLFEKALEDCTTALNLRPSYRKARTRRADCNMKLERWEAAIQDYEVLIQETPRDEEVMWLFSEAKRQLDRQHQENYDEMVQLKHCSQLVLVSSN